MELRIEDWSKWEIFVVHAAGVLGILISPITYPMAIGYVVWMTKRYNWTVAKRGWQLMFTHIKFQWNHNFRKFLKDYEYYHERFDEALDMAS